MFYHSSSVSITGQRSLTKPKTSLTLELEDRSREIRTKRKVTIPPISQTTVQAQCPTGGLCFFQNTLRLATKHLTLMANGIIDIFPHKPFNVLLSNFSPCSVHLSKNAVIGHALEVPERILTVQAPKPHLPQSKEGGETAEIFGSSDKQDSQQSDTDLERWRHDVHIGSQEKSVRKDIMSLLSGFASIWDGSLGKITTVKHHIDLQSDSRPAF